MGDYPVTDCLRLVRHVRQGPRVGSEAADRFEFAQPSARIVPCLHGLLDGRCRVERADPQFARSKYGSHSRNPHRFSTVAEVPAPYLVTRVSPRAPYFKLGHQITTRWRKLEAATAFGRRPL